MGSLARQERFDLRRIRGVVEDDQDRLAPGELRAVQGVLVGGRGGHVRVPHAEGSQQRPCGLVGGDPRAVVAAQVDEEHAAGEPAPFPRDVGRVHRERRLADTAEPRDRADRHRFAVVPRARGECGQQPLDVDVAPGEGGRPGRQRGVRGGRGTVVVVLLLAGDGPWQMPPLQST